MIRLILMIWILELCSGPESVAQSFKTLPVPEKYLAGYEVTDQERIAARAALTNPYDLTNALPPGYDTTGNTDYTDYLRAAIEKHTDIIMPDFPVKVSMKSSYGIAMKSNTKMLFQKNSKLVMEPNARSDYAIILLWNRKNITVYFANIEGDRAHHKGKEGERGMGISIAGSDNIKLIKPKISDCWGDGIYLGSYFTKTDTINAASNVYIEKAFLNKNRRAGLGVTSAKNLLVDGIVCSNTYGTDPQSGIVIEPGVNFHLIENIIINDPLTFNNKAIGIAINLIKLRWGLLTRKVGITINNSVDDNSARGLHVSLTGNNQQSRLAKNQLTGYINISNPAFHNQRYKKNLRINDFQQSNGIDVHIFWDKKNNEVYRRSLSDYNEQSQKAKNIRFSIKK